MAVLSGSIEADVPISFADRAWTEFVFRNLYGNYAKGFAEVDSSVSERDADSGTVRLETRGGGSSRCRSSCSTRPTPATTPATRSPGPRRGSITISRGIARFF